MTWKLASAEERARKNPKTFQIPSRNIRESLSPGNTAKLCFVDEADGNGERMWVEITDCKVVMVSGRRTVEYTGVLANHPVTFKDDLRYGQRITFFPEHVADWDAGP